MQQNDKFRLVVRRGPQINQAFEIGKDETTLGRDISNDIVINDGETSRKHLRLLRDGAALSMEDLGSTNGTFHNGKRIAGITPLQNGDMISLGETVTLALEVFREPEDDTPSVAALLRPPAPDYPPPQPAYPPPTEYGLQGDSPPSQDKVGEAAYAPQPASEPYAQAPPSYLGPPAYDEAPAAPTGNYDGQAPPPGYAAPPAPPQQKYPGYDYDPYAAREEGGGTSPWLILGCFVFFVLVFVCFAGIALFFVDTLNLWCDIPLLRDVVDALTATCLDS